MRLIKAQTTNLRNIAGKGVKYDIDDQVIVDSQRAMKVPSGPLSERPGEAGIITSGTFSPTLGHAIAMARIPATNSSTVEVEMRKKSVKVEVVKPSFVRNGKSVL